MEKKFLGKWNLLSDKSKYAQGIPPLKAIYEFKKGEFGSLDVSIEWTDKEGKDFRIDYNTLPDGQRKKYENPEIADEVMSKYESDNQLNSYTYKDGKTIAFASRTINEEGIMQVIQRFYTPDGKSFDNVQYYKKEKSATTNTQDR